MSVGKDPADVRAHQDRRARKGGDRDEHRPQHLIDVIDRLQVDATGTDASASPCLDHRVVTPTNNDPGDAAQMDDHARTFDKPRKISGSSKTCDRGTIRATASTLSTPFCSVTTRVAGPTSGTIAAAALSVS